MYSKLFKMENQRVILSTAYLPTVQYFSKLLSYKEVVLEKHETYPRQTYRNRCEVLTANGKLPLVIPVVRPNGNSTKISDVRIDYSVKWQREHWRALESAYKNSAYFELIEDEFRPFYESKEWDLLWDFNITIINTIVEILGLKVSIGCTNEFIRDYTADIGHDFRFSIHPKPQHSIRDDSFTAKSYFQVFSDRYGFTPNLSVFDLLCNCGREGVGILI